MTTEQTNTETTMEPRMEPTMEPPTIKKAMTVLPPLVNPHWDHEAEPPLHRFFADPSMDPGELSRKVAALCAEGNWYISLGGETVVLERAVIKARTWLCGGVVRYTDKLPAVIYERDVAFQGLVFEPAEGYSVAEVGFSYFYDETAILCASASGAVFPGWDDPEWLPTTGVDHWQHYVGGELRAAWDSFTSDQKRVLYANAFLVAQVRQSEAK